ncbi:MAG: response regulator transcription factor [Paracoccus sp. (in: a-proteobacteria)]|jgi:DNA-binding NarL/FixJ family response regulator|uniref:response regulator transcription factor n=2 Tax=Paracoccus TaxID=265 RepID=UPI000C350ABB|nr:MULTISPECIES: response regulator transcription factor [unclassified Paracoccus (in: a-proteobacteria)]MAN10905.1 DNA-binding response regulator [Sphingobium sp.]MBA49705.1 DNA-binding response regulator [Paracoccus sp. (in: a-proteobacteria)]|tara:strand:+ start:4391 stop:5017 length:627 start_codon:yes stop_codon:yes gene_type:complete
MKTALVIDDHPITHLGASRLLREMGYERVAQAMSGDEALRLLQEEAPAPDLIVLDISLPGTGGLDLVAPLRAAVPQARILIFSMNDQTGFAARALQAGAQGFLSKNAAPDDFRAAIRTLEAGEFYLSAKQALALATLRAGAAADPLAALSDRERQVLALIGRGFSLQAIADELDVSYKTAANTSSALKKKLGVDGINGLMKFALDSGV